MDKFVCVRIVQANTIDLTHFRFDFDQSFAAFLMDADLTIYGRFGTRSDRKEATRISSLKGLRKALESRAGDARTPEAIKPLLAGKQVKATEYKTPRTIPAWRPGSAPSSTTRGTSSRAACTAIRFVRPNAPSSARPASRSPTRSSPYPDPSVLEAHLNPEEMATGQNGRRGLGGREGGVEAGDQMTALDWPATCSTADLQWSPPQHGGSALNFRSRSNRRTEPSRSSR